MKVTTYAWRDLQAFYAENLSDKLWSAYATYVLKHCRRSRVTGLWKLDEMGQELLDLATNWDAHRTF